MNVINLTNQGNQNLTVSPNSVDAKDSLVQINTSPVTTSTVSAKQGFNIEGVASGFLANNKTVTLEYYRRQFFIVGGGFTSLFSNTIPAPNVPGSVIAATVTQDLIVGNNKVVHNLGATPLMVTFQQNGVSVGLTYNINTYGDPSNILNVIVVGKNLPGTTIFVTAPTPLTSLGT